MISRNDVANGKIGLRRAVFNCTAGMAAMLLLTGCTLSSPFKGLKSEPEIITGSVTAPVKDEGIDPTDAEAIKLAVAAAEAGMPVDGVTEPATAESGSHLLAWSNPETGNSGTITAIEEFAGSHGQSCRKFQTTVDSFMGISLYKGETCELKKGAWVLSWFIRATGG